MKTNYKIQGTPNSPVLVFSNSLGADFKMWDEQELKKVWIDEDSKKKTLNNIKQIHQTLKEKPNSYKNFQKHIYTTQKYNFIDSSKESISLGSCPVASKNTRCCNLLTLDVIEGCGFDCSYCSIQSFYNQNKVGIDLNFEK